ncbi:unnamed protein product [Alopecurus aequalis]
MLHAPLLRYHRLDDGGDGDSGHWKVEKRRKHLDPSLPSDTGKVADARISSSRSDAPGDKEVPGYTKYEAPWVQRVPDPVSDEAFLICENILSKRRAIPVSRGELDLEQQREVYKRLVLYRTRAHKLSKGESKDKPGFDERAAFVEQALEQAVSLNDLHFIVNTYFRHLEEQDSDAIDWYFVSRGKFEDLGDYQRLVIKNYVPDVVGYVYQNWEEYRSILTTYEMDKEYVKFVEEMSKELQWLKLYLGYPETSDVWSDMHRRGARQAFMIATRYTHMNFVLAYTAYEEYIWSSRLDYDHREEKDCLFFEIWKRVTKGQLTFEAALKDLLQNKLFTRHKDLMLYALEEDNCSDLEEQYRSCVAGIPGKALEGEAMAFIKAGVWKLHKVNKPLHQYMARKMKIAESIGLVKLQDALA